MRNVGVKCSECKLYTEDINRTKYITGANLNYVYILKFLRQKKNQCILISDTLGYFFDLGVEDVLF